MPLVAFLLAAAMLAVGIMDGVWPWTVDDAFISMRYAERLVMGDGLTWTDGERVEGYSNLLWVLLLAALRLLEFDCIVATRLLGITCTLGSILLLATGRLLPSGLPARLAVVLMASVSVTSVWTIGGLEAPLLLLFVTAMMVGLDATLQSGGASRGGPALAGVALALACWTRPDAPLWAAAAGATALLVPRQNRLRTLSWVVLPAVIAIVLQLGFRIFYYGDWLPNTAIAKVAMSAASCEAGLGYLSNSATALRALLVPAALGVLALMRRKNVSIMLFGLVSTMAWTGYVVLVGGDAFPQARFFVPTLAPLTVLAAGGFDAIASRGKLGRGVAIVIAGAAIVFARVDASSLSLSTWEQDGIACGQWLGKAFENQQPLVAVDAAGGVPFASRLPCLDLLGLNDRTIASTPIPPGQKFRVAHSRGNGAYVQSRQPDLIMFAQPPGKPQPGFVSGREMEATAQFRRDYRIVLFDVDQTEASAREQEGPLMVLWTRVAGRVGVSIDAASTLVPGYLLGSFRQPFSFLSPPPERRAELLAAMQVGLTWWASAAVVGVMTSDGLVVGEVRKSGTHVMQGLSLSAGRYYLTADAVPPGVSLGLRSTSGVASKGAEDAWLIADGEGQVDLVCVVPEHVRLPFRIAQVAITQVR